VEITLGAIVSDGGGGAVLEPPPPPQAERIRPVIVKRNNRDLNRIRWNPDLTTTVFGLLATNISPSRDL
jgi:hypothetical protein